VSQIVRALFMAESEMALPHFFSSLKIVFQNLEYLQHIGTFGNLKNLRYSFYITTHKGESKPMDLPFLLPQSRIFRAYNLTADLRMR
jgi:hypothetical protein